MEAAIIGLFVKIGVFWLNGNHFVFCFLEHPVLNVMAEALAVDVIQLIGHHPQNQKSDR